MEIFNEGTVLIISLLAWLFTDNVPNGEFRQNVGWVLLGIICLNVGINMFVNVVHVVRMLKGKCKGKGNVSKVHIFKFERKNLLE